VRVRRCYLVYGGVERSAVGPRSALRRRAPWPLAVDCTPRTTLRDYGGVLKVLLAIEAPECSTGHEEVAVFLAGSSDPWTWSMDVERSVDFCVYALRRDGLRVTPFDRHPEGDGSLRTNGLDAESWRT
jgi:hypothetical protein